MQVLIIEDESPAVSKLKRMLQDLDPDIRILDALSTVEASINWLTENQPPDLVFLDIQLEDGLCFEIFENIKINTPVIFTTAYDKYALDAFKVNSVDYLLKPFNEEALEKAIEKYKTVFKVKIDPSRVEKLINQFQPAKKERFLIKIGEHYRSVKVSDINAFYIKERYNFILTKKGQNLPIDYSLDKLEQQIDSSKFFRANRNIIISQDAISDIIAYSSSRLKIKLDGWSEEDDILISRDRVAAFKRWMDR
jgi:DNA-binding LytR/AlgR family response regulator